VAPRRLLAYAQAFASRRRRDPEGRGFLNFTQKGESMKSIKGTQTEKNVLLSFAGESQAA